MLSMETRVKRDRITAESVMTDAPAWARDESPRRDWYRVTLRFQRRRLTVPFGMGSALGREPTAEDVMECLATDAAGYVNASGFEDWASDYGYDPDSRKAEHTYRQVEAQTAKLRKFLGSAFDAYLFETES